jgi:hypothetical protein
MQPRKFYLDTQSRNFVTSPTLGATASGSLFFAEDVEQIQLYFLEPQLQGGYDYANYSANTVKLAVGLTQPAALQTSWTSISTAITASITTLANGGSGSNEVQRLSFAGQAPIKGGFALTLPSRNVTVSSVSAGVFTAANHGLLDGQSVTLSAFTISGSTFANQSYFVQARTKDTFRIATVVGATAVNAQVTSGGGTATLGALTTPQIPFNATAADVSQALVEAGMSVDNAPQISVTGSYGQGFTFTFANSQANINFDPLTVSSTLEAAPALQANVSFNTSEVAALIAAGNTSNLRLEVEVSDGTRRQTYQTACSISDDIISSTSPTPAPSGSQGFTMLSPDNSQWTITVDNDGVVTATKA